VEVETIHDGLVLTTQPTYRQNDEQQHSRNINKNKTKNCITKGKSRMIKNHGSAVSNPNSEKCRLLQSTIAIVH